MMMAVSSRCSCRGLFTQPDTLLVLSLMLITVHNLDNFQTNSVMHGTNTRDTHQLYRPTVTHLCIKQGVFYCNIQIFNSIPPYILKLIQKKPKLNVALRQYLTAHTSYSLDELLPTSQITFPLQH